MKPEEQTIHPEQTLPPQDEKQDKYEVHVAEPVVVDSQAQLDAVISNHQVWLESVLNPRKKIGKGRANLSGANLSGMDLTGVNLSGASFKEANLKGAIFSRANLTGADFSRANLTAADFSYAKLRRANLTEVTIGDTNFEAADLKDAKTDSETLKERIGRGFS